MSFHTFETRLRVSYEYYRLIRSILFMGNMRTYKQKTQSEDPNKVSRLDEEQFDLMSETIICEALVDKGIIIKLIQVINPNCWYNGIWLQINPRRVIDNNEYVGIFETKDVEKMIQLVNCYLKKIDKRLPDFEEYNLSRIDLCRNVNLENELLVEYYIDLIKRGKTPPKFIREEFYNEKAKKKTASKDGIKVSNGSISLVAYNKKAQMENEKYFATQHIQDAKGIIRFEAQLHYNKIYQLKKKNGINTIKEFLNRGDEFAFNIFSKYLPKLFCEGDYYTLNDAREVISNSNYQKKIKNQMLEFVYEVSRRRSLDNVIVDMLTEEKYSKKEIKNIIEKLDEIDVNPITIPRRWQVDEYLENPLKLILNHF